MIDFTIFFKDGYEYEGTLTDEQIDMLRDVLISDGEFESAAEINDEEYVYASFYHSHQLDMCDENGVYLFNSIFDNSKGRYTQNDIDRVEIL